jgi:hypothetical protein
MAAVWAGRFGPSSASMSASFGAPPAKLKAPTWASSSVKLLGQSTWLQRVGSGVATARSGA